MVKSCLATEDQELSALMDWAKLRNIPLVHHCNEGKRSPQYGKSRRLAPGFPDISLNEGRGGYFGLFLELKRNCIYPPSVQRGATWKAQRAWLTRLANEHYYACMTFGWDEARKIIEMYTGWPRTTFFSLVNQQA